MYSLNDLLNLAAREGAEELQLQPGRPPIMVLQGKPRVIDGWLITTDSVIELLRGIATEEQRRELDQCGDVHFIFAAQNSTRFSVSATMRGEFFNLRIRNLAR